MNNRNLSFEDSIINEIKIDDYYSQSKGIAEILCRPVIKISSMPLFLINRPRLLRFVLNGFDNFLWWSIYFINTIFLGSVLWKWINVHRGDNETPSLVGITTSPCLKYQWEKISFSEDIVYVTWENQKKEKNSRCYLVYLSFKDIFKCYIEANKEVAKIRSRFGKCYTLHAIKAFKWLLMKMSLSKFDADSTFIFCNHYDRWALLIDSFIEHNKILIQHGILNGEIRFEKKLECVDVLYCFTDLQYQYFKLFVDKINSVRFYKSTLLLTPVDKDGKVCVLIIGNCMVYKNMEEYFIKSLSGYTDRVRLFVKPHPVFPVSFYNRMRENCCFFLITDKAFFPEVDYVISYDSTLAFEYEQENIKLLYYNRMKKEDILKMVLHGNK